MINFNIKISSHNLQIISKIIPTLLKKLNKNVEKTLIPLNFSAIIQFKTQISGFRIKNKIKNTIDMRMAAGRRLRRSGRPNTGSAR